MTPQERADPKILNGSRRLRIAKGSGVTVNEVNHLVDRFFEAQKMMKQMGGQLGFPGAKRGKKGKKGRRLPAGLPPGMLPPGMGGPPGSGPGR